MGQPMEVRVFLAAPSFHKIIISIYPSPQRGEGCVALLKQPSPLREEGLDGGEAVSAISEISPPPKSSPLKGEDFLMQRKTTMLHNITITP